MLAALHVVSLHRRGGFIVVRLGASRRASRAADEQDEHERDQDERAGARALDVGAVARLGELVDEERQAACGP